MKTFLLITLLFSFNTFAEAAYSGSLKEAELTILDSGKPAKISQEKSKKLILFWATWCATCKVKLTTILPEMQEKYKDLEVLTVNIDKNPRRATHYVEKNKITLPVLRDEKKKLTEPLKVNTAPHWALFEKKQGKFVLKDSEVAFNKEKIEGLLK